MRLAAFDPRVRTLNGVGYNARQRYLSALHCAECQAQKIANLGRLRGLGIQFADGQWTPQRSLGRLRGMRMGIQFADGNWSRMSGLGQGDVEFEPTTFDPGDTLIAPSPTPDTSVPFLPSWPMPNPSAATLTPSTYDPTTGLIAPKPSLPASSSPGQPALTAAQVASIAAQASTFLPSTPANVAQPGTTFGIPNSYFLYGSAIFLGLTLLGSMKKR